MDNYYYWMISAGFELRHNGGIAVNYAYYVHRALCAWMNATIEGEVE